jgi:hypothetical protein
MDIKATLLRQYLAPMTMLGKAIELCPEQLWFEGAPNRFWHIAYHALFYTHFYLSPTDADFVPWPQHRAECNYLGTVPWKPDAPPVIDLPYTRAELLQYREFCLQEIETRIAALDLDAPSGFYWLPITKLELQLYNIRHLQHHTGQLADRLRTRAGVGVPWVR